jgi:hypothetical protein
VDLVKGQPLFVNRPPSNIHVSSSIHWDPIEHRGIAPFRPTLAAKMIIQVSILFYNSALHLLTRISVV